MAETRTQKMDAIIDNVHFVIPLFFRTLFRGNEELTPNPMGNEFRVLAILRRHNSIPTNRIGTWLHISKPNMTAIIDKLIEEGYVERQRDPEDRRVVNVSLTPKGRDYFNACWEAARKAVKTKFSSLTEDEVDSLFESLQSIRMILSKINEVNPKMNPPYHEIFKDKLNNPEPSPQRRTYYD